MMADFIYDTFIYSLFYLFIFVMSSILTYCMYRLCSNSTNTRLKWCLNLFNHYKKLISFYRNSGKWRKTIDKIATQEENIETFASYIIGNLGSDVKEKSLRGLLLPFNSGQKTDIGINISVDPKNPSLRKALVKIPHHYKGACDLPACGTDLDGRKISIQEIKKRKDLLRKDFKWVSPKPSVSVCERNSGDEAWKIGVSEYLLIDGGNHIMDIDSKILSEVLEYSDKAGIHSMVLTCSSFKQIKQAVKRCEQYPGYMFFTAGVHPSNVDQWNEDSLAVLEKYAGHPQCVAIGECGLVVPSTDTDKQVEVFRHQIELACKLKKPLWFCSLGADNTLIPILHEFKGQLKAMCVGGYVPSKTITFPHRIPRLWELLQMGSFVSVSSLIKESGGYRTTWFKDWLKQGLISPHNVILASNAPSIGVENMEFEEFCDTMLPREVQYLQRSTVTRHNENSSYHLDCEPGNLAIVLEIISSCMYIPPKKLASASNQNARQFFNFK